jgi:hypothetical protein
MYVGDSKRGQRVTPNKDKERSQTRTRQHLKERHGDVLQLFYKNRLALI